jgi:hypothetical protein
MQELGQAAETKSAKALARPCLTILVTILPALSVCPLLYAMLGLQVVVLVDLVSELGSGRSVARRMSPYVAVDGSVCCRMSESGDSMSNDREWTMYR